MRTRVARHVAWVVALGVVVLAATAAGAAAPYKVHITLKEFAFVPKTITVPAGPVQLSATNAGTVEHTLVIPALKVKSPPIKPGQTWTVTLTIPKGTYQGYCDVPGHKELGMVLTVVAK
jgi:nitrite reductase (NO-forming)